MKLIESKAEYLPQEEGLDGIYKQIEKCGRVCYKSEDKATENSAKAFVDRMIASKHTAMLEHGTVYLSAVPWAAKIDRIDFYPWIKRHSNPKFNTYQQDCQITCNYRMLVENDCLHDLHYFCSPTEFHERRYTFKFTCSRAIANELVRHRVFSFAQESTRYCNYSKDKFDNEVTFIAPSWYDSNKASAFEQHPQTGADSNMHLWFERGCKEAEVAYMAMLAWNASPQQARDVLPNATKTEIVMTGYESDWRYLFDLRLFGKTGAPHPDMVNLMEKAKAEAEKNGIWDYIMSHPSKFE